MTYSKGFLTRKPQEYIWKIKDGITASNAQGATTGKFQNGAENKAGIGAVIVANLGRRT
jgi:hypothetical protein